MASLIRSPRLSSEAFLLSIPGDKIPAAELDAVKPALKTSLHPVDLSHSAAADPEKHADRRELETLKEQLEKQQSMSQQLRDELDAHAEQASKSGYESGYQAGLTEGKIAARQELEKEIAIVRQAAIEFQKLHGEILTLAEDDAVVIVFEAISKILGEEVLSKQAAKTLLQKIMKQREELGILRIRFAPRDFLALQSHFDLNPAAKPAGVDIVADENIELGGCIVETKTGLIQARLEDQLKQLKELLLSVRAERS